MSEQGVSDMRNGRDHDGAAEAEPVIEAADADASAAFGALRETVEDLAADLGREMGTGERMVENVR